MVHYEFDFERFLFRPLQPENNHHPNSNLSVILKWSPYLTEEELLKQFDDVVPHGTKVIIYNLWHDNEGNMELDFELDPEDIRMEWDGKSKAKDDSLKAINENHIAKWFKYSLRAYLSILYMNLPVTFCIGLRQKTVLDNNIATVLKYPEFIVYKPNSGSCVEGKVITIIGFLKEAPDVKVHGFNFKTSTTSHFYLWLLMATTEGEVLLVCLKQTSSSQLTTNRILRKQMFSKSL